jgi:hypothetical protein
MLIREYSSLVLSQIQNLGFDTLSLSAELKLDAIRTRCSKFCQVAEDVLKHTLQTWPGEAVSVSEAVLDGGDLLPQTIEFLAAALTGKLSRSMI